MGGRLDATSLCKPAIHIDNYLYIAKDHTSHLGDSKIEEIAFEKASIIKEGGTVFAVKTNQKVVDVVKNMVAVHKSADMHTF